MVISEMQEKCLTKLNTHLWLNSKQNRYRRLFHHHQQQHKENKNGNYEMRAILISLVVVIISYHHISNDHIVTLSIYHDNFAFLLHFFIYSYCKLYAKILFQYYPIVYLLFATHGKTKRYWMVIAEVWVCWGSGW